MKSDDKVKFNMENRTCYYFDYIFKIKDFDFDNTRFG